MEFGLLKKIGFTDGEIKVYQALIHLGSSSTGNIMKRAGISSSKIYLILDKLIQKGIVSFVLKENVRYFQITNPAMVLEYINRKITDLEETKDKFQALIPAINSIVGESKEDSAQIYKGGKGISVSASNILEDVGKGGTARCFSLSKEDMDDAAKRFLSSFHRSAKKSKVKTKIVGNSAVKKEYKRLMTENSQFRINNRNMPTGVFVGKGCIIFTTFGKEMTAYEIISPEMAKKYQKFFDNVWNTSK